MALLQISEPGLSAAPHQRRLAVGIDLGTTNSLVATVRSGQAETLADEQGRHLLPSVVHYQQQGHVVGYDARVNAARDPANTISSVKRMSCWTVKAGILTAAGHSGQVTKARKAPVKLSGRTSTLRARKSWKAV